MQATQAALIQIEAMAGLAALARRRKSLQIFRGIDHLREDDGFEEFARTHLKIVDKDTGNLVPFRLNHVQRQILAAEMEMRRAGKKPNIIVLKFRQGGVTTLQQALSYWEIWRRELRRCRTFAHRKEDTREIFSTVVRFYENQPAQHRHAKTPADTLWLEFPDWDTRYIAETAAGEAGRGGRVARIHISEAAFCKNLTDLHVSLNEGQFPDAAYIWETTPNGRVGVGQQFFEAWQQAEKGLSNFRPLFFAWHDNPEHSKPLLDTAYPLVAPDGWWRHTVPEDLDPLSTEEIDLCKRFNLSPAQVNWWRGKRIEYQALGGSANRVRQEHPDDPKSCFVAGGESYFERSLIDGAEERAAPAIEAGEAKKWIDSLAHLSEDTRMELRQDVEHGRLQLFGFPREGSRTAIGADVSGGVGADAHAAVGVDFRTGQQLFTYMFNRMLPERFGMKLSDLGWAFRVPGQELPAYIGVEQQNHGHAALAGLMTIRMYPTECIYHHVVQTQADAQPSKRAGWNNNSKGHEELTAAVGRLLMDNRPAIRDVRVVESIREVTQAAKGGAEFTGRDLAVAAGIATIVLPFARPEESWTYMGGMLVNLSTGETRSPDQPASTEPDDDGGDGAFQWAVG